MSWSPKSLPDILKLSVRKTRVLRWFAVRHGSRTITQADFTREYARQCMLVLPTDAVDRKRYPQRDMSHFRREEHELQLFRRVNDHQHRSLRMVWCGPTPQVWIGQLGAVDVLGFRAGLLVELRHWIGSPIYQVDGLGPVLDQMVDENDASVAQDAVLRHVDLTEEKLCDVSDCLYWLLHCARRLAGDRG